MSAIRLVTYFMARDNSPYLVEPYSARLRSCLVRSYDTVTAKAMLWLVVATSHGTATNKTVQCRAETCTLSGGPCVVSLMPLNFVPQLHPTVDA